METKWLSLIDSLPSRERSVNTWIISIQRVYSQAKALKAPFTQTTRNLALFFQKGVRRFNPYWVNSTEFNLKRGEALTITKLTRDLQ